MGRGYRDPTFQLFLVYLGLTGLAQEVPLHGGNERHRERRREWEVMISDPKLIGLCRHACRLEDAIKLKSVAIGNELQMRGIRIRRIVLGEKNVEIIELGPIQPECWRVGLWVLSRHNELRD